MLQKPWFKLFVWFLSTFFFFLTAATIISLLKPGPSEDEVMKYMSGMMGAMENGVMGVMMGIESNTTLKSILIWSITTFPVGVVLSIIVGVILRKRNSEDKHVR
jgi:putative exporter of polyketide antibiotics